MEAHMMESFLANLKATDEELDLKNIRCERIPVNFSTFSKQLHFISILDHYFFLVNQSILKILFKSPFKQIPEASVSTYFHKWLVFKYDRA